MQKDSAETFDNKSTENESTLSTKQKTEKPFDPHEMLHHTPKGARTSAWETLY